MRQRLALAAAVMTAGMSVPAQASVIETIRARYDLSSAIETDVEITINWKAREKVETQSGHVLVAPGDRFRVDLGGTVWVCNGQTYWQYSQQNAQVVVKRLLDVDLSAHPSQILTTYVTKYNYAVIKDDDKSAILKWNADSTAAATSFNRAITLDFDKKKNAVTRLFVIDKNGNQSTYLFKKTRFGATPPSAAFEFEPPKGARVLDTRE